MPWRRYQFKHEFPVLKNRNLVPQIRRLEFVSQCFAAARLNRMALVVETKFQQHPMRTHRAAGSNSEQRQVVRHLCLADWSESLLERLVFRSCGGDGCGRRGTSPTRG